uniref:Uncharacterized protein n=1 Tax=Heterorhabditis bacteriophora TaxID=37862 RepID=A0A1I7WC98_HETBA
MKFLYYSNSCRNHFLGDYRVQISMCCNIIRKFICNNEIHSSIQSSCSVDIDLYNYWES